MNGDTIQEIKDLLAEPGAIKQQTALRLTLGISAQIYDLLHQKITEIEDLKKRVKAVEDSSIILWASNHPKLTIFIVSLYLVLSAVVDFRAAIAKALGL